MLSKRKLELDKNRGDASLRIRIGKPFVKAPVCQEIPLEHRDQVGQRPSGTGAELQDLQDKHGDECCPNLYVNGVYADADEGFDPQTLLDGLEEELDLPAVLVDGGDGGGSEVEVVGQKDKFPFVDIVPDDHTAELVGAVAPCFVVGELDDLVGDDVPACGHDSALDNVISGVCSHPGDEENALADPSGEHAVVVVTGIHDEDGIFRQGKELGKPDIGYGSFGEKCEGGKVSVVVEEQMEFDGSFDPGVVGPREQGETEHYDGGVEGQELVLEPELFTRCELATPWEHCVEEVAVQLPRPVLVSVGKRGFLGSRIKTKVDELSERTMEAVADLAEGLGLGEVAKRHGNELIPAGEAFGGKVAIVLGDQGIKFLSREERKYLTEDGRGSNHGNDLLFVDGQDISAKNTYPSRIRRSTFYVVRNPCFGQVCDLPSSPNTAKTGSVSDPHRGTFRNKQGEIAPVLI